MNKARSARWLTILSFLLLIHPASAATINVGSNCSLANAIRSANADRAIGGCPRGRGADTIVLQPGAPYPMLKAAVVTPKEDTGLPYITSRITVQGNDARIFRNPNAPLFRLLVVARDGDLTLRRVTLQGGDLGTAGNTFGGGILIQQGGFLQVTGCTIINNRAANGAGIYNRGSLGITHSAVLSNRGVGVETVRGAFDVFNSTFHGQSDYAIWSGSVAQIAVVHSTIVRNAFGVWSGGLLTVMGHSIFSGNTQGNVHHDASVSGGVIEVGNFNIFGAGNESEVSGFEPGPTDIVPPHSLAEIVSPTRKNNGGPTMTLAIPKDSPATDGITDGTCPSPFTDQRGVSRPQDGNNDGGAACDIGSFELVPPPPEPEPPPVAS